MGEFVKTSLRNFLTGRNIYYIISGVILVLLLILGTLILGPKIVNITNNPESLREYIGSQGIKSYLIFVAIQIAQTIFALIPGEVVELAAGYLYGSFLGLILCLIGVGIATTIIFGATRLLGRKLTETVIDKNNFKKLKFLQNEKKLVLIFFLLFFIPGTPKDLITYFAGLTKIKFGLFLTISTLCRIPSILTSTLVGKALGQQNYLQSVIIFAITGVVALCGVWFYHKASSKNYND